jgi:hypothetical protein
MSDDLVSRPWRCDVTGNPVGTDTATLGAKPCQCQGCRAAQALTEARAEIERLRAKPPPLNAQSLPGVDALVKTLEAQVDEALRSCLAEREGRLKAESELSTLRARVREVVGPFSKIDPFEVAFSKHGKIFRLDYNASLLDQLTFEHLRAARQLNEDLK